MIALKKQVLNITYCSLIIKTAGFKTLMCSSVFKAVFFMLLMCQKELL